jgi:drug/metabolite transporter (DMT)-like permease
MKIYRYTFVVIGCIGLLLNGIGATLIVDSQQSGYGRGSETELGIGVMLAILGPLVVAAGSVFLALGRGRSWKYGLLGLLTPLGLLFLCILEDHSSLPASSPNTAEG